VEGNGCFLIGELSRHILGGTEESHENPQSDDLVYRPIVEENTEIKLRARQIQQPDDGRKPAFKRTFAFRNTRPMTGKYAELSGSLYDKYTASMCLDTCSIKRESLSLN
jgi:hypothetical protein